MKLKFFVCILFVGVTYLSFITRFGSNVSAWPNGISGFTGSSSTGNANCNTCHVVSSTEKNENFTVQSNVPKSGFAPNTVYDFSVIVKSKIPRAGFDIRIENDKGELAGEISNKDSTTRLERGELIHTYYSVLENGLGKFDFTWTSPSTDEKVKLFAAIGTVIHANNVIDTLSLFSFPINKDMTTNLQEQDDFSLRNQFYSTFNGTNNTIFFTLQNEANVTLSIIDALGIEKILVQNEPKRKGQNFYQIEYPNRNLGPVLLKLSFGQTVWSKKTYLNY